MSDFYTSVHVYGGKILYRGIENGRKILRRDDYYPTLFVPTQETSPYTTIRGAPVAPMKPGNIRETKDFLKQYENVCNFTIFGNTRFEYCYIADKFKETIPWDRDKLNVCFFDIECGSENGFPEPDLANEEITLISFKMTGKPLVLLGCGDFNNTRPDVQYIKCRDEEHLLKVFLDYWTADYPDILSGYNSSSFDIVYIVNRIKKVLGEDAAKSLSPWRIVTEKEVETNTGVKENRYRIWGVADLDLLELFKKFVLMGKSRESYKLGDVCQEEIGEGKVDYEEYGNLHRLYKENYQLFAEYNIRDTELLIKLDRRHKMIDLVLTLCYNNKCNFDDAFQQVRMWDVIIFNKLKGMKKVYPPLKKGSKTEQYVGAFVKEPIPGKYKWVISEDLDSLYPHLIMQYNISPEKILEPDEYTQEMRDWIADVSVESILRGKDTSKLKEWGVTCTPNKQLFRVDSMGFLAELMDEMYQKRKRYKKMMGESKKKLKDETDPVRKAELEDEVARYNNLQMAAKVSLNSAYGSFGSEYFRLFDVRQASAITTSGQLSIHWIQDRLNELLVKMTGVKKDRIIAIDTDAVYLWMDDVVAKLKPGASTEEIVDYLARLTNEDTDGPLAVFIDKQFKALAEHMNAISQRMHMKREAVADVGVWTGKKRYALSVWDMEGLRYKEPEIKVTGLDIVRSTSPAIVRKRLKEALKVILHKNENEIQDFVTNFREEFMKLPLNDISCPRGVHGLEAYATDGEWKDKTPFHVKASITYNRMLKKANLTKKYQAIKNGEKIRYLYLNEPNPAHNEVIAYPMILPSELGLDQYIDRKRQFEMTFLSPLRKLLDAVGWKEEEVASLKGMWSDD